MHQRVGEGVGIFREIEAGRIEPVEWIVAGRETLPLAARARAVTRAFSPLGSMQITERSSSSRLGIIVPTPLPERVGAIVSKCAAPS
jgi:hypothetical protein